MSGVLAASDSVAVDAPTDSYELSIRWLIEDGAIVKKGDKVLEMDATAILNQLDNAESSYIKAGSELAQQQNNANINAADKKHLLRQAASALKKAELNAAVPADAYPRRVYEDMQLALKRAKSEHASAQEATASETKISNYAVKQARVAVSKAEREMASLDETLKEYIISAPKDGIVIRAEYWRGRRPYDIGDKTWPGQTILLMPNLSVMKVKAHLSDVDDGRIHVGMTTQCTLDAFPNRQFEGRVTALSPVAIAPTYKSLRRAFEVEIQLDETDGEIMRPGMSVQVEISDKLVKDALLVPRAGLLFEGESVFALFPGGGRQSVKIGPCSAQACVLLSGLEEGTVLQARGVR
jgi:multidrug resistance efflux pump